MTHDIATISVASDHLRHHGDQDWPPCREYDIANSLGHGIAESREVTLRLFLNGAKRNVTGLLALVCLAAFLYLIDYSARFLRPVSPPAPFGKDTLLQPAVISLAPVAPLVLTMIPLGELIDRFPHIVF
jgi:hypothetical protein